ncbi:MAG: radical SAM protein [Candidatus Auribacterota bacterium]
MKILFIYPNLYAQIGFNYGVAYLSAVLRRHGHHTQLLNINDALGYPLDLSRIKKDVLAYKPDLIAFSVVTNQYKYAKEIAGDIRSYYDVPMLCGGIHATMDPEHVLLEGIFDYICLGEGEGALLELVTLLEGGEDTSGIQNIWTLRGSDIIKNPVRPFVDLATLPQKDYSIFDFQHMTDAKSGWVGLMASRGCPFRCTYCLNHKIIERYRMDLGKGKLDYLRHHPVEHMIEEIDYLLTHYKRISMFIFDDDLFTFNREFLRQFCEEYKKLFKIPFVCNAHVKVFDAEMAGWLKNAGCQIVKFGLESGSQKVRTKIMHRHMTNKEIEDAFAAAEKVGLHTSAFVMMGLPGEDIQDMQETVDLLGKIQPGRFRWAVFFPFINTQAYQITCEMGLLNEDKMNSLSNFTDESSLNFPADMQRKIQRLQKMYPWYVNAASDSRYAPLYRKIVDKMEQLPDSVWDLVRNDIRRLDKNLASMMSEKERYYSIRYNTFTGVRSDWAD